MADVRLRGGVLLPSHLLGTGGARGGHASAKMNYVLGSPGTCPEQPTLIIKLFDNSGSVTGGNDGVGNRYAEAAYALDKVSRRCRCGDELAAIVHFDVPTSGDVPPTPIKGGGRDIIGKGLAVPSDGGGISELRLSLDAAYAIAAAHPKHQAVLVVFSDFELFDPPGVLKSMADFPGIVHAVVLRSAAPPEFLDDPRVVVTPIGYDSEPGSVALAVFDALTTHRPKRRLAGVPKATSS